MNIIKIMREKLDGIKVDRRVLWGTIQDSNRRMLLQTVISALKNNGQTVYQTGIETNEEAEFALECGCDYLQGFYFSQPVPMQAFLQLYAKKSSTGAPAESVRKP